MTQSTITITGTQAGQYTPNTSSLSPFSNVIIADSAAGQIETVTVFLQAPGGVAAPGNGLLSNLGAGSYDAATGAYTVTGTAAQVTAALNNLVFTPTNADAPEHSVFAISVVDSAGNTALNRITTVVSAHPITIATNGVTTLASVANAFVVENLFGTSFAFLKLNGSVVTTSTFSAGWTPIGAVQRGNGYEVAFSNGQGQYVVWNVDGDGNYVSNTTGILSSANAAELAALEANFDEQGANADFLGTTPASPSTIADNGTTTLALVGNLFELNPDSGGTGPLLELNGGVVTTSTFLATGWAPVGAVQTGNGYEVAFENAQNQFVVWNVDSNGNYISNATGILSGASPELAGVEAAFGDGKFTGSGVGPATLHSLAANGVTELDELEPGGVSQTGDAYELNPAAGTGGPLLEVNGSVVTKGQFSAGWTPVGALWTGNGYEVAFWNNDVGGSNKYVVWNVGSNGDYISAATGVLAANSLQLADVEAAFGDGKFTGAAVDPATATKIATNGTTTLAELEVNGSKIGDAYELNPAGGTGGPLLELNGSVVTKGQFQAGWTPVGAVQTATGYEVAFGDGKGDFVVWNTDSNGNFTSNATGILSATSYALESLETSFGEDLNGDGTTGPTTTKIGTNGVLIQIANQYELTGGTAPFLMLNGSPVTTTTFTTTGWTPVGAVQTATGYEVAFGDGKGDFVVWNTDSNGNFIGNATPVVLANSPTIEGVEANFGETFKGAGTKATATTLATNTITTLAELEPGGVSQNGDAYELNPVSGTGPLLELNGGVVTKGQFGAAGWTPVGALQTGNGYEVAFSNGKGQFVVWNTDANGNFTGNATPVVSANTPTIEGVETAFGETFAGAGTKATPTQIAANTVTQLDELEPGGVSQTGDAYELNPAGGTGGPLLQLNGSVVTKGQFTAGWTPVGALKTGTGYEVAFSNGANSYVVWNTDSNGDYTSNATGVLSSSNSTQAIELAGIEAAFGESFATGVTAATPSQIGTPTPNGQLAELEVGGVSQTGDAYELGGTGGPLLEEGGVAVTAGSLGGWQPIGAQKTDTGYEVVWSLFNNGVSQDTYTVWNTDSGGNYTSSALGLVSGQNFNLEDLNVSFGENLNGASSLSTKLATTTKDANTFSQTDNTTIVLGNNGAFANNTGGLGGSSLTFSGTPFALTLGSHADIIEYTLTPGQGIETVTGFGNNPSNELNINLRGAPSGDLLMHDNGLSSVSIYSSADPTHGVVLLGEQSGNLNAVPTGGPVGQGHVLITLKA
jgi:hypothetical protein